MSLKDCYFHIDSKVIYVTENIPGPLCKEDPNSLSLHEDFNSQLTRNCLCENTNMCKIDVANKTSICACVSVENGANYFVNISYGYAHSSENLLSTLNRNEMEPTNDGEEKKNYSNYHLTVNEKRFDSKSIAIYECNNLCSCYGKQTNCYNRLVQYGPRENLKIVGFTDNISDVSQNKGLGLITEKYILKGSFVCEYAGEVITKKQAIERHKRNASNKAMNYIICLNEYSGASLLQTFVDPSCFGNIGRYMNHSCEPNCAIIPVRVDSPIPKLCMFTLRNIEDGEELTFDYGSHIVGEESEDNLEGRKMCLCGSLTCRKFLPYHEYS